jgi:hypothetical protein
METPFHSLLQDDNFDLINEIVKRFQLKVETKFDEDFLKKIKEMFIFILENIYSYDTKTIESSYCNLTYEMEIDEATSENIKIIKTLLTDIKNSISNHLVNHREILLDYF